MSDDDKIFLYAWLQIKGFGVAKLKKLRDQYGSFKFAWLQEKPATFDPLTSWQKLLAANPQILTLADDDYPKTLLQSYSEPLLFYRGNLKLLNTKCLCIVGSRKLDQYNALALKKIFAELVNSSLTIVSGLAYGIDALAHQLALENNLPTIAVLGSPINDDEIYPRENIKLANAIIQNDGLLISPFPTGTPGDKNNFPRRNQTIAGLSDATLVVSAALKSGALITARLALEYNREIMAIPGNINQELSSGTNKLLQQGAHVITQGSDILEILGLPSISNQQIDNFAQATAAEKQIITLLKTGPLEMNDLLRLTTLNPAEVRSATTQMELKNWIERKSGNIIALR